MDAGDPIGVKRCGFLYLIDEKMAVLNVCCCCSYSINIPIGLFFYSLWAFLNGDFFSICCSE